MNSKAFNLGSWQGPYAFGTTGQTALHIQRNRSMVKLAPMALWSKYPLTLQHAKEIFRFTCIPNSLRTPPFHIHLSLPSHELHLRPIHLTHRLDQCTSHPLHVSPLTHPLPALVVKRSIPYWLYILEAVCTPISLWSDAYNHTSIYTWRSRVPLQGKLLTDRLRYHILAHDDQAFAAGRVVVFLTANIHMY